MTTDADRIARAELLAYNLEREADRLTLSPVDDFAQGRGYGLFEAARRLRAAIDSEPRTVPMSVVDGWSKAP